MRAAILSTFLPILLLAASAAPAQEASDPPEGTVPAFALQRGPLTLERTARPGTPFNVTGRRFALLGEEGGGFEAWAWPLKLLRGFEISFLVGESTRPVAGSTIARRVTVTPAATSITWSYQSFTVTGHYIAAPERAGALLLLEVDSTVPLTIVCGMLPVLQPMWPAGFGGQWSYWNGDLSAYVIGAAGRQAYGAIGSPLGEGISYTPAHMLADSPSEFKIEVQEPARFQHRFVPVVVAGGPGEWEEIEELYRSLLADPEDLYQSALERRRDVVESTLQLDTPDDSLDLAFQWAKLAYDGLLVNNPHLEGTGLVAGLGRSGTSGRPGFGWFFGGDAYINSFSMASYGGFEAVKQALEFLIRFQRDDGKMVHEVTQAVEYCDWFEDYGYAWFHGDTTPYFVAAFANYVRTSGDTTFARRHWDIVVKAVEWSLATDENGDGLMDNSSAGAGALEYGELKGGIASDVYLAGIGVRALEEMAWLARVLGEEGWESRAREAAQRGRDAFDRLFWDEERSFYSYAFTGEGKHIKEFSPWSTTALSFGIGTPERSRATLRRIASAELMTDWGVRSISRHSSYYSPLNYNYGAVWPFLNSWVSAALFRQGFAQQGYSVLRATAGHSFTHQLGAITEVFSGTLHTWPQEAVSHQGFSTAGAVRPLVRGLLGMEGDALERRVAFQPQLPADWDSLTVSNWQVGEARLQVRYRRTWEQLVVELEGAERGWTARIAPLAGPGVFTGAVQVNGTAVQPQGRERLAQGERIPVEVELTGGVVRVRYELQPTVEVLPSLTDSKVGDPDRGLKLVSLRRDRNRLLLTLEGLAGKRYPVPLVEAGMVVAVTGAGKEGGEVVVTMPEGEPGSFVRHEVTLTTRR